MSLSEIRQARIIKKVHCILDGFVFYESTWSNYPKSIAERCEFLTRKNQLVNQKAEGCTERKSNAACDLQDNRACVLYDLFEDDEGGLAHVAKGTLFY